MLKSRQIICLLFVAVGFNGCQWNSELYNKFVDKNGELLSCTGICTGIEELNSFEECNEVHGIWRPGICYELQPIKNENIENTENQENSFVRVEVDRTQAQCQNGESDNIKYEWEDGYCFINSASECQNAGGNWESYDYSILDLGNGEYIRRIKEEKGKERYICGSYAVVYLNDVNASECKEENRKLFKTSVDYQLCTKGTMCQPAYQVKQYSIEEENNAENAKLAICNSCPLNNTLCRNTDRSFSCKNLDNDPLNCGGCGNTCGSGMNCIHGVCEKKSASYVCKDGGIACGKDENNIPVCYDPSSIETCGAVCENDEIQYTACVEHEKCLEDSDSIYSCQCLSQKDSTISGIVCGEGDERQCLLPDAEATCGATCENPAGTLCPNHTICKLVGDKYECECKDDLIKLVDHDGSILCIDPQNDASYCGLTADAILAGETKRCLPNEKCSGGKCICQNGYILCDGACINPLTDLLYCGASEDCKQNRGEACGDAGTCVNGECTCNISRGYVYCDDLCIDPETNADYCGASDDCIDRGEKCPDSMPICRDGKCQSNCPVGQTVCGSSCVDIKRDANNCDACGKVCTYPNASAVCVNGECRIGECHSGYANCDAGTEGEDSNGCEVNLHETVEHCGVCDNSCEMPKGANGVSCEAGKCKVSWCEGTTMNCGDTCIDVSSDINNCGACENKCNFRCFEDEHCESKCENGGCCATGTLGPNPVVACCEGYELYRYVMNEVRGCRETWHYKCVLKGQSEDSCYRKV